MGHADSTPPEGVPAVEIPPEPDTSPQLPLAMVPCPECGAVGMKMTCVELDENGCLEHAAAAPCPLCKGATKVTRKEFRAWHARRQGR